MARDADSIGAAIASRTLECHDPRDPEADSLTVQLFAPRHNGSEWECTLAFARPGRETERQSIYGIDSMQSLLLAVQTIDAFLVSYRSSGLELTWLGEPELGFLPQFDDSNRTDA